MSETLDALSLIFVIVLPVLALLALVLGLFAVWLFCKVFAREREKQKRQNRGSGRGKDLDWFERGF